MAAKYPMHKDFRFAPRLNMRFSRVPVAMVNAGSRVLRYFQYKPRPDVTLHDLTIPGGKNKVRLKIFRPAAGPENRRRACLIQLHGGAFFLTYVGSHLNLAAEYAARLGAVVVFVDYALAPFPAGFNDSYDASIWVRDHADTLGINPDLLLIEGDSAGGSLAAAVVQRAHDEKSLSFLGQVLIYPVIDHSCTTVSAVEFMDTPIWTGVSNKRMWKKYLQDYAAASIPPYAAPASREYLRGLPPAYIELAEFDPLHDEGLAYAKRLKASGVEVEVNDTKRTIHGYSALAPRNPISVDSINRRIAFMERCLSAQG